MKIMILLTSLVLSTITATSAFAAQYEKKDLTGRLLVMDQSARAVQGVIEIRPATKQDNAMGDIVAEVNMDFKGESINTKCSGNFEVDTQQLALVCGLTKVLAIKLNNSNVELISYLQGSFSSAEISFVTRPLTENSEKISVDIKNLDMR